MGLYFGGTFGRRLELKKEEPREELRMGCLRGHDRFESLRKEEAGRVLVAAKGRIR